MTDEVDVASQIEEDFRQHFISHYRKQSLLANGRCYNCEEVTCGIFCCVECREDWEKRKFFESQRKPG